MKIVTTDLALATLSHVAYSLRSIADELSDSYFSDAFRVDALKRANRELGSGWTSDETNECIAHLNETADAIDSLIPEGFNPDE